MSSYNGIGADEIIHGSAYIEKHGFGGEVYNFRNSDQDEMFWKYPKYEWQSELRFAIPNIYFEQLFGEKMEYQNN